MQQLLFFTLALICEVLGTVGGFGSSVLFVPMAQFFFSFQLVLMLTSILHVFSNLAKILLFRQHIDKRVFLLFGIPSLLLTVLGAWLTAYAVSTWGSWILAVFLVLFSTFLLVRPHFQLPATSFAAVVSGGFAGFFAGFVGTGGAIRGLSMAAFNLEKNLFVGTSAAIDTGVDISRFFIYLGNGFFKPEVWVLVPVLFLVSFVGSWLGKKLLNRLSQDFFRRLVLAFILITGLALIYQQLSPNFL